MQGGGEEGRGEREVLEHLGEGGGFLRVAINDKQCLRRLTGMMEEGRRPWHLDLTRRRVMVNRLIMSTGN